MTEQNNGASRDRLEQIKEEVSKFSQQVNDYLKGRKEMSYGFPTENELAILRHARAIVEEQLLYPPDAQSQRKLMHVRNELNRRITAMENAIEGLPGNYQQEGFTSRDKIAIVAVAALGVGLLALGAYLTYRKVSEPKENPWA
jgi:hypothetical protein